MARRGPLDLAARSWEVLGAPGLVVGLVSIASLVFGALVVAREYDRLDRVEREAALQVLETWARSAPVDEVGRALPDYADTWRVEPGPQRLDRLQAALDELGRSVDERLSPFASIEVEAMALALRAEPDEALASWGSARLGSAAEPAEPYRLTLLEADAERGRPAVELRVRCRTGAVIAEALDGLEVSYRRLLLAVLGLSGYSLLCLAAMVVQARHLQERSAREAAQRATLDLADRTCHELGNIVFVMANEGRNLTNALDQVERFLDEDPRALDMAARAAGLEPEPRARFDRARRRALEAEGLEPEADLRPSLELAREVCRQIDVCSSYIALTVRELDSHLKESKAAPPSRSEPVAVAACLDEALTLLGPRLGSAGAEVERPERDEADAGPTAWADRRLLVHALVNLLKNAVEAAAATDRSPQIRLRVEQHSGTIRIAVIDNGPGLDPNHLKRLFEPGFSTKGPGRGRGLAIARESIRGLGGDLTARNLPEGGSAFVIELPAGPETTPSA